MFKKKEKSMKQMEKELIKAKKELAEKAKIEKMKAEQQKPEEIVETNNELPNPPEELNTPEAPTISEEELQKIKEQVEYYNKNYRGIFTPTDFAWSKPADPIYCETNSLLFGILQELRALNDHIKE